MWSFSCALLDVLRRDAAREGRHKNAHPEAVCDHRVQRDLDNHRPGLAQVRACDREQAPGALQGFPRKPEAQVAQGDRAEARGTEGEHFGLDFREVRDRDDFVLRGLHSELVCSKLPQEAAEEEGEPQGGEGLINVV